MDAETCPNCNEENAFFTLMDKKGAHYECPNCSFEWVDDSIQIEGDENDEEDEENS